jgi:hypothetical protein
MTLMPAQRLEAVGPMMKNKGRVPVVSNAELQTGIAPGRAVHGPIKN